MVIGFTGKKRSGKSTACEYMEKNYGFVRINFKDALIEEIKLYFPDVLKWAMQHYSLTIDELFTEKPPIIRTLMQNFGTEIRRKQDPDYWVKRWQAAVHLAGPFANVVTDDVRFLNEADALRLYGIVIRIVRDDLPNDDAHSSETEMDQIIPNNTVTAHTGEHQKLYEQLETILQDLHQ